MPSEVDTGVQMPLSALPHPHKLDDGNDEGSQCHAAQVVDECVAQRLEHREGGLPAAATPKQVSSALSEWPVNQSTAAWCMFAHPSPKQLQPGASWLCSMHGLQAHRHSGREPEAQQHTTHLLVSPLDQ